MISFLKGYFLELMHYRDSNYFDLWFGLIAVNNVKRLHKELSKKINACSMAS